MSFRLGINLGFAVNKYIEPEVRACAICGSDIRIFHYGNSRVKPPQILGHESAGEVAEVGAHVKSFKPGDRLAIGADVPCGECSFCEAGIGNNCQINYAMGYQFAEPVGQSPANS